MSDAARYWVGIDLGTTQTLVAYAEQSGEASEARLFAIDQLVAAGEVARRTVLPSMRYHPAEGELAAADTQLPWGTSEFADPVPSAVLGAWAWTLGTRVQGRLVTSAKSWLSHAGVDRSEAVLPWGSEPEVPRISPVDASASYLAHIRAAWNWHSPEAPLEAQALVLTVPASFDEVARELTVEAARRAGLADVRLLEEPQAACYYWLSLQKASLAAALAEVRMLLVCDLGGGTTDFSLIRVGREEGDAQLARVGVGDHLMLGGDNLDLALARHAESQLPEGRRLSAAALFHLIQQCRDAKEVFLAEAPPETVQVTVLGSGAKVVGGSRSVTLERSAVHELLVDGFFPEIEAGERPERRRAGIVEFGLPYAADPRITAHLAAFLDAHAATIEPACGAGVPDAVLFNGGLFQSPRIRERLQQVLGHWRGAGVAELSNDRPSEAVAMGGVAYARARAGEAVRIGGGTGRGYYLSLDDASHAEAPTSAVCLLPRGTEEDTVRRLSARTFSLRLGEPVRFHLASATRDAGEGAGDLVTLEPDSVHWLPPIATSLAPPEGEGGQTGAEIAVQLEVELTEVGTLKLRCVSVEAPDRQWALEFQLRGDAAPTAADGAGEEAPEHPRLAQAREQIQRVYGKKSKDVSDKEVKQLRSALEKLLGDRDDWATPLLRALFDTLMEAAGRRRRSADHERVWLNLAGYTLRPGFGASRDPWRIESLWAIYNHGVQHAQGSQVWSEWWTLWRRVAGGLDADAQQRIYRDLAGSLQPLPAKAKKRAEELRRRGYDDMVRLVAALEHLSVEAKVEAARNLLKRLQKTSESPESWWAVGRIGARQPFYGSAHRVVPADEVAQWLEQLLALDWKTVKPAGFAATMMARMSGDRARDLNESLRARVVDKLKDSKAPERWVRMVEQVEALEEADERQLFGEALPSGLTLIE